MAIVSEGDRILVVDKRLFKDDNTRLFVGIVEEFAADAIRARGFSFHVSPYEVSGAERRGEERVRIITLSAGDIVFVLPRDQDLTRLQLKRSPKSMQLTDGTFAMDLSDFMLRA
jgi:translation initiation factor IF-1